MIINLTNDAGITTIKQLKAVLDKYPEDWKVSICGESDIGAYINYDTSTILIDDLDWLKNEIEK